jgi:hypothetical protein
MGNGNDDISSEKHYEEPKTINTRRQRPSIGPENANFHENEPKKCSFSFKSFSACVEEVILVGCFFENSFCVKVRQNPHICYRILA